MKYGQKVKSYSFDKTGLQKSTFVKFNRFIMVIRDLRVLSLDFNNVGNEGIKVILDSLKNSPTLYHLNISENLLNNEIVPSLCSFITINNHIESIECERNNFGDLAFDPISKALASNKESRLKCFRLGTFLSPRIEFFNNFQLTCSNAPSIAVGSITYEKKISKDQKKDASDYSYAHVPVKMG